ncbi:MAG: LysR family transcriptional regulator, partial [Caulobacter sp.]|nr:LysR family transcriptional regulator [Caulobacter sp.]
MNALKAFDAAARCGGFTAAALELSVGPGAVSRHVANLEEFFGEPLFERHANEIALTPAGTQYFARIRPALDVIEDASRRITESSNPRQVHVAAGPGLGRDWLLPRLSDFVGRNPHVQLELSTKLELIERVSQGENELELEDVDV